MIERYTDEQGENSYGIYYKRDDMPWQRLATAHHKTVAEQVVARLKAVKRADRVATRTITSSNLMSANHQSTSETPREQRRQRQVGADI